ncbi:MAG: DNA polymerase III subunit chi [Alphaproteobacteria bacterium]
MPPEIWFYHLERAGIEAVLPPLLEKTLERGWRALVRTTSKERVAALDDALWSFRDDAFLPHGRADHADAELQPILISERDDGPNKPDALFLIDGAEPGEIDALSRVVLLFDGHDETAVASARARWSAYKEQGIAIASWQQGADGRWEKKV